MAKKFGFFNSINGDRRYLATDISQAFNVAVTNGLQAIPDSFKIVPNDGMTVKMLPGGCMIHGAFCVDNEDEIIELDVADGELNRIDRVVIRYDRFERSIKTAVIKGTPALNPTPPAPLRNENQFDLVLADIRVNKAVTSITASDITDMRYSELCGFIGVKGAVTEERFESHLAESAQKHITESGSNSNGRYIKFDDGTMICTGKIPPQVLEFTEHDTGLWRTDFISFAYPQNFVGEYPALSISSSWAGNYAIWINSVSRSLTEGSFRAFALGDQSGYDVGSMYFSAIGRWK